MFGLYADDIELKNKAKKINLSDYEAVCFDEIAKHSPDRLKRIAQFIVNNPDKYIFGAGDYKQIKPINYGGSQNYLDDCINIIFPNQILLNVIKRLENKADVLKMESLYDYIFSGDIIDLKVMCKKFKIKKTSSYADLSTVNILELRVKALGIIVGNFSILEFFYNLRLFVSALTLKEIASCLLGSTMYFYMRKMRNILLRKLS